MTGWDEPDGLSALARAYAQVWDVLRADTDHVLVELFRADPDRVEAAREEFWAAHTDWIDHPPPHLHRRPPHRRTT